MTERDSLRDNRAYLEEERARVAALVEERQRRQSEGEKALESERARALALAKQVDTVGELVARMEKEIERRGSRRGSRCQRVGIQRPCANQPGDLVRSGEGTVAVAGRRHTRS